MDGDTDTVGQIFERLGGTLPRRTFRVGAGAAIVATACGRGTETAERTAQPTDEQLSLVPASAELAVGDERVAFAIFRGKPISYTRDASGQVHPRRTDDANFVHVEIYKDQRGRAFAPGTAAWSIDKAGEPWVFFVSSDGVVRDRLSGPIGEWEVDEAVERLVSG